MGKTFGIIASGPSCTREDAINLNAAVECIAINDSYRLAPTAHLYSCDYEWARYHCADVMRDFDGTWWTQTDCWQDSSDRRIDPAQWGIRALQCVDLPGLSKDQGIVHSGANSGYQAINLAYLLGATRIILIGYDMSMDGNRRHWFGDHPAPMNGPSNYDDFIQRFARMKPENYGLEILNCSRRTELKCFPLRDLDEWLASNDHHLGGRDAPVESGPAGFGRQGF